MLISRRSSLSSIAFGWLFMASGLLAWEVRPLTRVADIRALSREEARKSMPVKIRGVVTWRRIGYGSAFVIQDDSQGIYADLEVAMGRGLWKGAEPPEQRWKTGTFIEVEGFTDPGGYAPVILPVSLKEMGSVPLPPPRTLTIERLLSGNDDSQRVQVEGVVQALSPPDEKGLSTLLLIINGHRCRVRFEHGDELVESALVDAQVRVKGVFAPMFNLRGEMIGLKIHSMGVEDIEVLRPPLSAPFEGPRTSLNRLFPFSPDRVLFHRQVTEGIVTMVKPGEFFFLQDDGTGIRVRSSTTPIHVGDNVEVAGFVEMTHNIASLGNATVRSKAPATAPFAETVTIPQISPFREGWESRRLIPHDYCGRLVRMTGKLIRLERDSMRYPRLLWIESEGQVFSAIPPDALVGGKSSIPSWEEGAELALTGVCEFNLIEGPPGENWITTTGFQLWLRTPGDVEVLRAPSWWTAARLRIMLLGAGVAILLGLIWISLLRWLLRRRTERLEEAMTRHRDFELEYASAQRERLRLAVDLHDGIKQHIAAASLRVEAAAGHLATSPEVAASHLDSAFNALLRTQTELEECLWGLHAVADGPPDFVDLLRHVTLISEHWPQDAVTIRCTGKTRHLARNVAGNLLLLFQEACGNAFRHGHASTVSVRVDYGLENLELIIVDDGEGFDPVSARGPESGHFGITGMRKRMNWLNGSLHITRHQNGGTEVRAKLPWTEPPQTPTEPART